MAEIKELDFQLMDEGWERYGGKSFNVWGLVDFPPELLKYILDFKKKTYSVYDETTGKKTKMTGKRAPVWTAFDKYLYHDFNPADAKNMPKISATFKSCFDNKYSAIVENMGMQIAIALDMPTSYNYIVAFDPEKHPKIVANYPIPDCKQRIQPIGIVSIDFLQARQMPPKQTGKTAYEIGDEEIEIDKISFADCDRLITFEDALHKLHMPIDKMSGEENYIENWIEVVDRIARTEYTHLPREQLNKIIDDTHSRIARAFLLKDCILGDCDFTAYNGGIVVNSHKMRYAATHDYGDICNGLVKNKLTFTPCCNIPPELFKTFPQNVQDKIMESQQKFANLSVEELASQWASSTSERNFYYVLSNFPQACSEFFKNLDNLAKRNQITKIVDQYTKMTVNGTPLLSKSEADMFKRYLSARLSHYCNLYVDYLNSNNASIPQEVETDDYSINL